MAEQVRIYTEEDFRTVCNAETLQDGLMLLLSFAQRLVIALEGIAAAMVEPPTALFQEASAVTMKHPRHDEPLRDAGTQLNDDDGPR